MSELAISSLVPSRSSETSKITGSFCDFA